MIRLKHPSRHYIFYLFSRRSLGASGVVATLAELGLPVPLYTTKKGAMEASEAMKRRGEVATYDSFKEELRRIQQKIEYPPEYNPLRRDHAPSMELLRELGIYDLWRQEPSVMAAFEYLRDPHICRMLQIMLLGPLNHLSISQRLAERYGLPASAMNPQVVRAFSHYFWNYESLNRPEWEQLIWQYLPGNNNDLITSLRAPRSAVGAAMALYMADQGGSESLKEVVMYRHCRDASFHEFCNVLNHLPTGLSKATAMLQLTQSLAQNQQELDVRRGGSAELLDELRRIEATYDPRRLTSVEELPLHHLPAEVLDADFEEVE
jgi:hypothetical protein